MDSAVNPATIVSPVAMSYIARGRVRSWIDAGVRKAWRALHAAAGVAVVVVPFGYAVTGAHNDVLLAAGCGIAVGVGLGLRMPESIGRSVGFLVGTAAGMAAALLAGLVPGNGIGYVVPPVAALSVGLVDGLGTSRLRGYRDGTVEAGVMSSLLALGMLPAMGIAGVVGGLVVLPTTALIAGAFTVHPAGRRFAWPPLPLVLGCAAVVASVVYVLGREGRGGPPDASLLSVVGSRPEVGAAVTLFLIPVAAFLAARAASVWLQPRLRVYRQLAEYLSVMWIPIGGFAIGYLALIVVFAGFGGMLARFSPGAFTGAADAGIGEWIAFSFFRALARDYPGIVPVSSGAWLLVGVQAVLTVGWALVVFAAVMSSIQPRLERIARQTVQSAGE